MDTDERKLGDKLTSDVDAWHRPRTFPVALRLHDDEPSLLTDGQTDRRTDKLTDRVCKLGAH